ncbi:hypothetical protein E4U59_005165 [Claviceps monticola]|nr:hypothetical protein E4U59_005165 [Claviceps monticola]
MSACIFGEGSGETDREKASQGRQLSSYRRLPSRVLFDAIADSSQWTTCWQRLKRQAPATFLFTRQKKNGEGR